MNKPSGKQQDDNGSDAESSVIGRRSFLKGIAALGGGAVVSALAQKTARARLSGEPAALVTTPGVIASDAATVVETTAGRIRGFWRGGIFVFKGVPYGASTSGADRFMPPAKPEPWAGIRNALQYGRVCLSAGWDSAHRDFDGKNSAGTDEDAFVVHRGANEMVPGEDCLRLNVWTPEINRSKKRPVMVYMHGGGFSGGCGHNIGAYDGENLARNDVVVVTHNHRLNVFGYLNLAELGGERYVSSGNAGLLDLVAVLQWVRDNISNFGGDPGNVTIFGQSGGGGKVLTLMAMPAARGLFHRAAVQSGPYLKMIEPDYSARLAAQVMAELGLARSRVEELHRISIDRIAGAASEAIRKLPPSQVPMLRRHFEATGWGPTVDGVILPHHPFDPAAPAVSADVPLLTGSNLHEFVNGLDNPDGVAMAMEQVNQQMGEAFGARSFDIIEAYRKDYPKATPFGLYAAIAAASFRRPAITQALRKSALGVAPAYEYLYCWRTPVLDDRPGTFHAAEIPMVFDNAKRCDHYSGRTPAGFAIAKQMSGAWVSFARSGNPNHPGIPHWPVYAAETRATMIFDTPCAVRNGPEAEGLRLIDLG